MKPAVFLDRQGTLIEPFASLADAGRPDGVKLIRGAAAAVASLRGLGYHVVVITNQPGIAHGHFDEAAVAAVHRRINELLSQTSETMIDRFYYCPFDPEASVAEFRRDHPWRKPNIGMVQQAAKDLDIDMARSWMVGDGVEDMATGVNAELRTIRLHAGKRDKKIVADSDAATLIEAVKIIAQQARAMREAVEEKEPVDAPQVVIRQTRVPSPSGSMLVTNAMGRAAREQGEPDNGSLGAELDRAAARASDTLVVKETALPRPATTRKKAGTKPPVVDQPPSTPVPAAEIIEKPAENAEHEAADEPAGAPDAAERETVTTLRQILHELRSQRHHGHDFSNAAIIALVFQMVAVVCVIGAFMMAGPNDGAFLRWIGTGILVQLVVIALLLFDRQ